MKARNSLKLWQGVLFLHKKMLHPGKIPSYFVTEIKIKMRPSRETKHAFFQYPGKSAFVEPTPTEVWARYSNITLLGTDNAVQKRLIQRRGSQNQDSIPQAEDNKGTSLPIDPRESKVEGARKNKCRSQSESFLSVVLPNGLSSGDKTGSLLSPQLCPPIPPKSPKPRSRRSNSLFYNQSSKTNIELMATAELSGKFKTVGHCVAGVAVISRLNGKLQGAQNVELRRIWYRISRNREKRPPGDECPECSLCKTRGNNRKHQRGVFLSKYQEPNEIKKREDLLEERGKYRKQPRRGLMKKRYVPLIEVKKRMAAIP